VWKCATLWDSGGYDFRGSLLLLLMPQALAAFLKQ
jgi:hypothetical protein